MATTFGVERNPPVGEWSTGLCYCCADAGGCCLTFFCSCVTFGRIARIVDKGAISCCTSAMLYMLLTLTTGMGCLYSCCYRSKLRTQYGLTEKPCGDCCVHYYCGMCALCQEYRELKARGFDMSLGWEANMERMGERRRDRPPADVSGDVPLGAPWVTGDRRQARGMQTSRTIHVNVLLPFKLRVVCFAVNCNNRSM